MCMDVCMLYAVYVNEWISLSFFDRKLIGSEKGLAHNNYVYNAKGFSWWFYTSFNSFLDELLFWSSVLDE